MIYIQGLGALSLASRLKNISDQLMAGLKKVYIDSGTTFEPAWFPVIHYLYVVGPASVTHLSKELGVTHPAVVQIINKLEKKGLAARKSVEGDERVSMIILTHRGEILAVKLIDKWAEIKCATEDLIYEIDPKFMDSLRRLEKELSEADIYERIKRKHLFTAGNR